MSQGGGPINQQLQSALMAQYPMAQGQMPSGQIMPGMSLPQQQGNQAMVQSLGGAQQPQYPAPQAAPQAPQGGGSSFANLMHALMTNPAAFTGGQGGGFAQTLAANPATVQQAVAPQAAPNPIPDFIAAQQAAAAQAAATPPPAATGDPNNPGGFSGGGSE